MLHKPDHIIAILKPPSLRVRCIADVAPEVLDALQTDLEEAAKLFPFPVVDIQIAGSAARGDWQFHSDLDVCFATGTKEAHAAALQAWKANPDQSRQVMTKLRELSHKWGVRIELNMAFPTYRDQLHMTYYSLRERTHYRPEMNTVVSKYFFTYIDEDGNMHFNDDPYPPEEVEKWAKRYGSKAIRLGFTKDTKWIRERGSPNIPTN